MAARGRPKKVVNTTKLADLDIDDLDGKLLTEAIDMFRTLSTKYPKNSRLRWLDNYYYAVQSSFEIVLTEEETDEQYDARIAKEKVKAEKSAARRRVTEMNKIRKIQAKLEGLGVRVVIEEVKPEVKKVTTSTVSGFVRKFDFENV